MVLSVSNMDEERHYDSTAWLELGVSPRVCSLVTSISMLRFDMMIVLL